MSIKPNDIDLSKKLLGSNLGNYQFEKVSILIIKMCRKRNNNWSNFSIEDYKKSVFEIEGNHIDFIKYMVLLDNLVNAEYIIKNGDSYTITTLFLKELEKYSKYMNFRKFLN